MFVELFSDEDHDDLGLSNKLIKNRNKTSKRVIYQYALLMYGTNL